MILRKLLASSIFMTTMLYFSSLAHADSYKITANSVNVRSAGSTNATVLGQVHASHTVNVIQSVNGWYQIQYGTMKGWIHGQFLRPEGNTTSRAATTARPQSESIAISGTMVTNASAVNLRNGPGTQHAVITSLAKGVSLNAISSAAGWTKVKTNSGTVGFILSSYLSKAAAKPQSVAKPAPVAVSRGGDNGRYADIRNQIVAKAHELYAKNISYRYGGNSPAQGFDCSGLVVYLFKQYKGDLQRVAADQARQGVRIDKGDLKPGDLVFFDTDGGHNYVNHVGIYVGNGDIIHASSGQGKITLSDINSGFYARTYMWSTRILN